MKENRIKRFNENSELNISDVSGSGLHPLPKIGEILVYQDDTDHYMVIEFDKYRVILKPHNFEFTDGRKFTIYPDDFEEGDKISDFWNHFNWIDIS